LGTRETKLASSRTPALRSLSAYNAQFSGDCLKRLIMCPGRVDRRFPLRHLPTEQHVQQPGVHQVTLSDQNYIYSEVYLNSFDPNNACTNYLADTAIATFTPTATATATFTPTATATATSMATATATVEPRSTPTPRPRPTPGPCP